MQALEEAKRVAVSLLSVGRTPLYLVVGRTTGEADFNWPVAAFAERDTAVLVMEALNALAAEYHRLLELQAADPDDFDEFCKQRLPELLVLDPNLDQTGSQHKLYLDTRYHVATIWTGRQAPAVRAGVIGQKTN